MFLLRLIVKHFLGKFECHFAWQVQCLVAMVNGTCCSEHWKTTEVALFVSHCWGMPLRHFMEAISSHCQSRAAAAILPTYWVCTSRNNHWEVRGAGQRKLARLVLLHGEAPSIGVAPSDGRLSGNGWFFSPQEIDIRTAPIIRVILCGKSNVCWRWRMKLVAPGFVHDVTYHVWKSFCVAGPIFGRGGKFNLLFRVS